MKHALWITVAFVLWTLGPMPALAKTPDGDTPASESVCDGLERAAYGLCTAYCEALDCAKLALHDIDDRECGRLLVNFQRKTGKLPPCFPVKCGETFPQCNGLCKEGTFCFDVGPRNGCRCLSEAPKCGSELDPQCGGACPPEKPVCLQVDGRCTCTPGVKCGAPEDPQCDGTCPVDAPVCLDLGDRGGCTCVREAPKCGSELDPQCDGACPPETPVCRPFFGGGGCSCATP